MIMYINARHTEGDTPSGSWLWFTLRWSTGEWAPLPAWYCTGPGEPKIIGDGWFPNLDDRCFEFHEPVVT
jgi:hypothetical protein